MRDAASGEYTPWFLTGDLGTLSPTGQVRISGRAKEVIKKGGEQVSPLELESVLIKNPLIEIVVCFPVPSDTYGEEVGCAIVPSPELNTAISERELTSKLRGFLRDNGVSPFKFPSKWRFIEKEEIPRTPVGKFIRNQTWSKLKDSSTVTESLRERVHDGRSWDPQNDNVGREKPAVDWPVLNSFRFVLICYVLFMHIGDHDSWGAFANLRQFPWHMHAFFLLAGFTLAVVMPSHISRSGTFIWSRIMTIYPLYIFAVILVTMNFLVGCRPGNFLPEFQWIALSDEHNLFCRGTPLIETSWWGNFASSLFINVLGLQTTPFWLGSWFTAFYFWFISIYFQCIIVFPLIYNACIRLRKSSKAWVLGVGALLAANVAVLAAFWFGFAQDATGYGNFDPQTGQRVETTAEQVQAAGADNAVILGFYLFSPFWILFFVLGIFAAFLYDAIRPSEGRGAYRWGYLADGLTVVIIAVSILHIAQGYAPSPYGAEPLSTEPFYMRPAAVDTLADAAAVNRIWDSIYARLFAPLVLLWIFALATGQGLTARLLRNGTLSNSLAPTVFGCFLFQQVVAQWYYAATREGEWWNWWDFQKSFYWFSPQPVPVEWYEYFYLVALIVLFSKFVSNFEPTLRRIPSMVMSLGGRKQESEEVDTEAKILTMIEGLTGLEASAELSLEECGLASLTITEFKTMLEAEFSSAENKVALEITDILSCRQISDLALHIDEVRAAA